jgi:hypothetical protein
MIILSNLIKAMTNKKQPEFFLVYRRSVEDDGGEWKAIFDGLPEPGGTIIPMVAANPKNNGEFYAINNRGLFLLMRVLRGES